MVDSVQTTERTQREAVALVDRFASFLKSSFIYPASHRRVVETASELLEVRHQLAGPDEWTVIRFSAAGEVKVDGLEVPTQGALAAWVRDTFARARLAGVELGPGLDHETLTAYAEELRRATTGQGAGFSAEWVTAHAGIRPVELVFDGHHSDRPSTTVPGNDDALPDVGLRDRVDPFADDPVRSRLLDALQGSGEVLHKLAEIQREANRHLLDRADIQELDLVSTIIAHMSTDVSSDVEHARHVIVQVLDQAQTELMRGLQDGSLPRDRDGIGKLMRAVAKKFFDFQAPVDAGDRSRLPEGRPEDEAIQEDPHALAQEIEALPDLEGVDLLADHEVQKAELFGVYLHSITTLDDRTSTLRYEQRLLERLPTITDGELKILDTYIAHSLGNENSDDRAGERNWRVVDLLRRSGHGELLARTGQLTPDVVCFAFPDFFTLFVDSLDTAGSEEDRDRLRDAMQGLGRKRVAEHAEILCAPDRDESLLRPDRVAKLLSVPTFEMLALAGVFAVRGDSSVRHRVARFLRRFDLPVIESLALRAVHPPSLLPSGYLQDLCLATLEARGDEKLREYSAFLLRDFIERATAPEQLEFRLQAIRQLRFLPSADTIKLLERLRGNLAERLLRSDSLTRAVRQVAASTLKEITG